MDWKDGFGKIENLFSVRNKVVLITGAGGLGAMYAQGFAQNGAKVILANRTLAKAENVQAKLKALGYSCDVRRMDVSKKDGVNRVVSEIAETYGTIDVLIHTAASCKLHNTMEDHEETFRLNCDTNMMGSVFVNQAVGNIMAGHGKGSIININTMSAFSVNSPDGMSYGVSKAALMQITKWFAVELAKHGVTVNGIAPIWIDTPMMAGRSADYMQKAIAQVPMGRMSYVEDYLGMGLFLASDASRFVTGQTILVDGGWSVSRRFKFDE